MASIVLVGLSANYPIPGVFLEIDFAQGPVSGSGSQRKAIVLGNKTAAGAATNDTVIYGPDTQVPCQTEADVINLFGTGSQLHRAYLKFAGVNQLTSLYFVAVSPSAGAAATIVETIATTATSNGNHRTWCGADFVDTAISLGDTATTIATNVAASVNSQTRWPVTANAVAGAVTYTAKNLGPEGNWIRMQALIQPGTGTIGTTTTLTANTFLSGGTTPDVNTTALATIKPGSYYYIISCDSDATNVGAAVSQVNTQAQPTNGIRQRVFSGSMDTLANTITLATGINAARSEVIWGTCDDYTPLELAAFFTGLYALLEAGAAVGVARKNFSNFPSSQPDQVLWTLKPGRNGVGGAPTQAQLVSALNNGISPLSINNAGATYLVKRCTTRSLNGAVSDFRIRDAHKVSVCDFWGDDAVAILQLQYGGKDLLPDPAQGQPPPPAIAATPRLIKGTLDGLTKSYGNAGQFKNADTIIANSIVQQETNPSNRVSALYQLTPVDILDQVAVLALQTG